MLNKAFPLECLEGGATCGRCGFAVPCRGTVMHVCSGCGAGCHLKRLLRDWLGIEAHPGCACEKRAQTMDVRGPEWCLENLDTIVGWLREEHGRQKILLPFSELVARVLVRTAIRRTLNS